MRGAGGGGGGGLGNIISILEDSHIAMFFYSYGKSHRQKKMRGGPGYKATVN